MADGQWRMSKGASGMNPQFANPLVCATLSVASVTAGLMLHQFTSSLNRQPLELDLSWNLARGKRVTG